MRGDRDLECEEELLKQFNSGGFPYVVLRLANVFGPKACFLGPELGPELRRTRSDTGCCIYGSRPVWALPYPSTWTRAPGRHAPHLVPRGLKEVPISLTYTPDIAQAVRSVISKGPELAGQAFNLACEEMPDQRDAWVAEKLVRTTLAAHNMSCALYVNSLVVHCREG